MPLQKRNSFNPALVVLFALTVLTASAQTRQIPRDSEQLIRRAQQFWAKVISRQPTGAMEFVLAAKRDAFLSSNSSSIIVSANVVGLDLGEDTKRARVRVNMSVQSPDGKRFDLTVGNPWVWQNGNWFIDDDNPAISSPLPSVVTPAIDAARESKEIEDHLHLSQNILDMGTLVEGIQKSVEVPSVYDGSIPLTVQSLDTPGFIHAEDFAGGGLNSYRSNLSVWIDTSNLQGDYSVPMRIQFSHGPAIVERNLIAKWTVFAPITFRMGSPGPVQIGAPYTTYIRNNTPERLGVRGLIVTDYTDIIKSPEFLEPNQEAEFVWQVRSGPLPLSIGILVSPVVAGRTQFNFALPKGPAPTSPQ